MSQEDTTKQSNDRSLYTINQSTNQSINYWIPHTHDQSESINQSINPSYRWSIGIDRSIVPMHRVDDLTIYRLCLTIRTYWTIREQRPMQDMVQLGQKFSMHSLGAEGNLKQHFQCQYLAALIPIIEIHNFKKERCDNGDGGKFLSSWDGNWPRDLRFRRHFLLNLKDFPVKIQFKGTILTTRDGMVLRCVACRQFVWRTAEWTCAKWAVEFCWWVQSRRTHGTTARRWSRATIHGQFHRPSHWKRMIRHRNISNWRSFASHSDTHAYWKIKFSHLMTEDAEAENTKKKWNGKKWKKTSRFAKYREKKTTQLKKKHGFRPFKFEKKTFRFSFAKRFFTHHICQNKRPGRSIFRAIKSIPNPSKTHRFYVVPPLKNHPSKAIGFVYSPLWKIPVYDGRLFRQIRYWSHSMSFYSPIWSKRWSMVVLMKSYMLVCGQLHTADRRGVSLNCHAASPEWRTTSMRPFGVRRNADGSLPFARPTNYASSCSSDLPIQVWGKNVE